MADINQSKRAEFFDDDPFAELTRIMGHDPRAPGDEQPAVTAAAAAPAGAVEDDFDIDLEKELMGELDCAEFDEPEADETGAPEMVVAWDQQREPAFDAEAADEQPEEAASPLSLAPEEDASIPPEQLFEAEDFGAALERELFPEAPVAVAEEPVSSEPEAFAPQSVEAPISWEAAAQEPLADDHASVEEPEIAEPVAEEPAVVEPEEAAPVAWQQPDEALGTDDGDFDLSFLEEELAGPAQPPAAVTTEAEDAPAWGDETAGEHVADAEYLPQAHEPENDEPEPVSYDHEPAPVEAVEQVPEPAPLSLEDELYALLADEQPASADVAAEPHAGEPAAATPAAPLADKWRPSVDTFGRANFAPAAAQESASTKEAPVQQPPVSFDEPEPQEVVEPAAFSWPAAAEAAHQPAATAPEPQTDDFADMFGDDFALDMENEPAQQAHPEPQPSPAPVTAAATGLAALSQWFPRKSSPAEPVAAPEVETVEVTEAAQPLADDLDIPEVDYGAAEPRAYDDLDAEFTQAFGDLSAPVAQPEPAAQPAPAAAAPATVPEQDFAGDAYAIGEGEWQASVQHGDASFDYETDLEHAMAMSAFEDDVAEQPAPRKRGLMVAALVAGVAVIGGGAVVGMSFLGGGSDAPALVRADPDPMKVRPENPGGTTVPNQDKEVYQRVSGGEQPAAPDQERLITSVEEPVDVGARAEPPALAPGVSEPGEEPAPAQAEASDVETAALDAEPAKSEERLEPAETQPAATAAEEIAAVAPRRVRTMIVRPDGTMVPREEPAAAPAQDEAAESVLAATPSPAAPALTPANQLPQPGGESVAGAPAAGAEEEGGPSVATPPSVAVVPSRRVEPQAVASAPAAAAPAQPAVQQPAATPASAPAAAAPAASGATSEWSMQIASQPTAEGAQATYQDLARRYGSVLEGRGVNIVRANIEGMGTYYRVRIPASNRDEAIQLCTRYKAAGGSCFVSR